MAAFYVILENCTQNVLKKVALTIGISTKSISSIGKKLIRKSVRAILFQEKRK